MNPPNGATLGTVHVYSRNRNRKTVTRDGTQTLALGRVTGWALDGPSRFGDGLESQTGRVCVEM